MAQSHIRVNFNLMAHSLMNDRNPQSQDKYIVRMPDGMREQIKKAAAISGRSMNAEIVYRLERSFSLSRTAGYAFFEEAENDDGLSARMSEELNTELLNSAAAKGITLREEIEERLWFSMKPQNEINERLAQHLLDTDIALQSAQHELRQARALLDQLSPAEKLILRERDYIANMRPTDKNSFRTMIEHVEIRPIGRAGRTVLKLPSVFSNSEIGKSEKRDTDESV